MMKRKIGLFDIVLILVVCVAVICIFASKAVSAKEAEIVYVGFFDPADYEWGVEHFP